MKINGQPPELFDDVAWETYCPVARLGKHIGETVVTCGLVVEQRTHHQIHRRADEIPDADRLDGHDGNRTVRAHLQKLRAGNRALSAGGGPDFKPCDCSATNPDR